MVSSLLGFYTPSDNKIDKLIKNEWYRVVPLRLLNHAQSDNKIDKFIGDDWCGVVPLRLLNCA
jgi:hypothetical protein